MTGESGRTGSTRVPGGSDVLWRLGGQMSTYVAVNAPQRGSGSTPSSAQSGSDSAAALSRISTGTTRPKL